jgi:hypothetical protein
MLLPIKSKTPESIAIRGFYCFLWYLQESNQGHADFQSAALPTELRYQHSLIGAANIIINLFQKNIF